MNYKKLILVGCISAFVAFLTSVMGVAGTIIGSVLSSVLYNMLTEALEKPIGQATFSTDFEWDIAYIFPIVVIALIQLLLIFALLAEMGILPYTFLNAFLSLQHFADNNLYRLLGVALIVISVYPLILKPEFVKKEHGIIIAFVGLVFLARGFVDLGNSITNIYDGVFRYFDLPIAIIAFILLVFVIYRILVLARKSESEFNVIKHGGNGNNHKRDNVHKVYHSKKHDVYSHMEKKNAPVIQNKRIVKQKPVKHHGSKVNFKNHVVEHKSQSGINESSEKIQFESNDLLDDYKK